MRQRSRTADAHLLGITIALLLGTASASAGPPARMEDGADRGEDFSFRLNTDPLAMEKWMSYTSFLFHGSDPLDSFNVGIPYPGTSPAGTGFGGWNIDEEITFDAIGFGERLDLGPIEVSFGYFEGDWSFGGERSWQWSETRTGNSCGFFDLLGALLLGQSSPDCLKPVSYQVTHTETEKFKVTGTLTITQLGLHWPALVGKVNRWRFSLGPEVGMTWTEMRLRQVRGGDPGMEAILVSAYGKRTEMGFPLGVRFRCGYSINQFEAFLDLAYARRFGDFTGDQPEVAIGFGFRF